MQFPKAKNEINWGTALPFLFAVALSIGGWVWYFSALAQRTDSTFIQMDTAINKVANDLHEYKAVNGETRREIVSETAGKFASLEARLNTHDQVNAGYRLPRLEASIDSTNKAVDELKAAVASLGAEQRLTNQKLDQMIEYMRNGTVISR